MKWIDNKYGFTGETENEQATCNIDQNRIIIWPNNDPIEQIEIEIEYPMPLYNENQMHGIYEGFTVFIINLTGNNEYDITQLKSAIDNFIAGNIPA